MIENFINAMYSYIGRNKKMMRNYYHMYNQYTDNDRKSHVDYFRQLQYECSFVLYQVLVERARDVYIQAIQHERNYKRMDYRNGYKMCKNMRVPGAEHLVTFTPQVRHFPKRFQKFLVYKKMPEAFNVFIRELLVHGRSSNDIKRVIASHFNVNISKQKVLSVLNALEGEYAKWMNRPLTNDFQTIFIDGTWTKVRHEEETQSMAYITALGMKASGEKEVLGFRLAKSEGEDDVYSLLKNIRMRGVKDISLVVADGAGAFKKVSLAVWSSARFQLCTVHKQRNIMTNCRNKRRVLFMEADARRILRSPSFKDAQSEIQSFKSKWGRKEPVAVRRFLRNIELCFTYCDITDDPTMRKKLHSTNHIENLFSNAKPRMKELGYMRSMKRAILWAYEIIKEESKKSEKLIWAF